MNGSARAQSERELKFAVPAAFVLPSLEDLPRHPVTVPSSPVLLDATYHDTDDLRLARWGVTLRYRNDEGWVCKLPTRGKHSDRAITRDEIHIDGPDGSPPAEAQRLVRALVRDQPLSPVARLRTQRRRLDLVDLDGTPVAEVTDDTVTARRAQGGELTFREVEIELAPGAHDEVVDGLVDRMQHAGAGRPDPMPKLIRALGSRALLPPEVWAPAELPDDVTAGELVRVAIAASVSRLLRHDPGVRLGGDPEDVHQARVATRRLRSDLRTFRDLLEPDWVASFHEPLRALGGALGLVRDNEVLSARIASRIALLPEEDHEPAHSILDRLAAEHDVHRRALLELLDSDEYVALLDRLVDAAHGPAVDPLAHERAVDVVPSLMRRPWKHLRAAVAALGDDPPDPALHQVRIRAKRARYAAEAVMPVMGNGARAFAKAMADLQDVLGEHQDAVVCGDWLRTIAPELDGPARFVAGQLVAIERIDARRHRDDWEARWDAASKKKLRKWW